MTVREYFENLTWESFKLTLEETLRNPGKNVPQNIQCPAVMTLFRDIAQNIGETAIQKTGEPLTPENIFNLDQRLALVRILEALVRIAEKGPVHSGGGGLKSIPESPIMKGLGNQVRSIPTRPVRNQCPHRDDLSPGFHWRESCVLQIGHRAFADDGKCIGCRLTNEEITRHG
jgi:hypothetical protein